jgi:hypothetical protein
MSKKPKPLVTLERNNAGRLHIGVTEYDKEGWAVRAYVLSSQSEHVTDSVMEDRYEKMVRLMGDNIRTEI